MNRKIIGLLDRGVTVVTPTRNLARCLEFAHSRSRLDRGDSSWPSADILDWSSWCLRNWDELQARSGEYPVVLSSQQEHSLWLQLVRESPVADGLLQVHATARQVLHAYQACKSWQIPVFPDAVYLHEDARQFRRWVRAYESMLAKNGWVDRASLPDHLARRMAAQATGAAADIAFYGFDRFTPQQRNLLGLSAANVLELGHEVRNQRVLLEVASDPRAEIRQAANWARQCLERDPGCRIGIVIANLARDRQRVDNIFARELALRQFITSDDDSLPYSISQGRPLVDYPLVRSAVHILSLMQPELQLDQLSLLLRSDFIRGYAQEQNQRARLDAELHANGEMRFDLSRLIWLMQNRYAEIPCPQLLQCLQALQEFLRQLPSRLRPGEWVIRFAGLFQVMGWPGEQSLDSHEYQTLQAWKKALDDMAGLDLVINQMDRAAACTRLSGIVAETGFQPETPAAPVQITGLEGTAALGFDCLRITGLHDQAWPAPVQMLPFIPLSLQRDAGLPAATAAGRLQEAGQTLQGLVESATEVVLSYPAQEGDCRLRPSALLREAGYNVTASAGTMPTPDGYYEQLVNSASLQVFEEPRGPAISEATPRVAGSSVFKDQALCPFRAYANHRLHASAIEAVEIGLSPRDRGSLLHRALQNIWDRLHDSKQLKTTAAAVLQDYIQAAVSAAVEPLARARPVSFTARFRALEEQRLVRLVNDWLQVDLQRPPFTVAATEKGRHISFAGITLRLRLDRVDALADGRLVIIDYKTGLVNPGDWETERPRDPQLPLYAVTAEGELAALVYASLRTGDMQYIGLAQEDGLLPGKVVTETAWQDKLADWREVLQQLGRSYIEGEATVAPRDNTSCRTCDLHPLCRIHEKAATLTHGETDD